MREQFEKWCSERTTKQNDAISHDWEVWQASRAVALEECDGLLNQVRGDAALRERELHERFRLETKFMQDKLDATFAHIATLSNSLPPIIILQNVDESIRALGRDDVRML